MPTSVEHLVGVETDPYEAQQIPMLLVANLEPPIAPMPSPQDSQQHTTPIVLQHATAAAQIPDFGLRNALPFSTPLSKRCVGVASFWRVVPSAVCTWIGQIELGQILRRAEGWC